ncbi:MAG TPA: gamma-glutamyl-gamma-aminobutyrate hydrolase family protein [Planctomycetota bacterium]|nr:gamma-glutamyl-gamma-aminobutyrate hydrolase family protein [Planctomycetota bacterium]
MKKKPQIGINCKLVSDDGDAYYKLDRNYVDCVLRAGGDPVLMPFFRNPAEARSFLGRLDGMLLTGGPDINPRRFGEKRHPKAVLMHADRESSDFAALREALRLDLPTLAICLACQELNVLLGGSLHQHVEDLPGVKRHSGGVRHVVTLTGSSRTGEILGTAPASVNSWHHQACRTIGKGLLETARSPDGLVEGLELPSRRFVIGVQWHPERMRDDDRQQRLFRALVDEARRS